MRSSKLSEHIFKKGTFITPWNNVLGKKTKEQSWSLQRLPEYLWLALILDRYGRKDGLNKCYYILKKLHEIDSGITAPVFSSILELNEEKQEDLFLYINKIIESSVLSPLTLLFTYSDYRIFARKYININVLPSDREKIITEVMKKYYFHQSELATDIRFLVLFHSIQSGKYKIPSRELDLILEYPKLEHTDEKMRLIRPTIRSLEMMVLHLEVHNEDYLKEFWRRISKMTDCELYCVDWKENNNNADRYMELIYESFQYFTDCFVSKDVLSKKELVLLGLGTYSYKRVLEVYDHNLYNSIASRGTVRTVIECYIMMKYLLKSEGQDEDIWMKYEKYGIGLYKTIVTRYRDAEKELNNSHVDYKYIELLVNELMDEEYLDMDTSYFDKKNIREKAIAVGEKELFGLYYDYDSSFEHGLWGAIRESSLLKCNAPTHQYHCVPDIDNKQKLKSVWPDCIMSLNKIVSLLNEIYKLPASLYKEVIQFEQ